MNTFIVFGGLFLGLFILFPLSVKWELKKKITIPAACIIGIISGVVAGYINNLLNLDIYQIVLLEIIIVGVLSILLILWRFYRDPVRTPPDEKNAILSPADGKIVYVKKIESGEIPFSEKKGQTFPISDFVQSDELFQEGYLIGIAMTYLDVHVNRAPITGRVTLINHITGNFFSLKKQEAVFQNERALIIIDGKDIRLGIVQIASRMVRNITSYITEGQHVSNGVKIGMIRFGSQVDVILPQISTLKINVELDDQVKAGLSIIAHY